MYWLSADSLCSATHNDYLPNEQSPAPFGQLELDFDLGHTQRHAGATPASSVQQSDAPNTRFTCPHCDKGYTTKKSLAVGYPLFGVNPLLMSPERHLTATKTACAQKHVPQVQSTEDRQKPRWGCSRCGKDYASISSVEVCRDNSFDRLVLTKSAAPHQQVLLEDL